MELRKYVGLKIKEMRLSMGMNQERLAELLDTTKQSVSRYETGERKADQDILFKLAEIFKVSINDFFPSTTSNVIQYPESSDYPIYPSVSAGVPIEIDGVTESNVERISIPDSLMGKWAGNSEIYITRTNGDSMNKIIPHDTLIAVKPIELHELKDNDIVVYRKHGEYAVKKFEKHDDKLVFRPDSTDSSFTDDVVYLDNADDLVIKGKVIMHNVIHD